MAKVAIEEIYELVTPYITEHERTLDPEHIRDFLDLMIVEHKNSSDQKSCFNGEVGLATILNSIVDLFIAGMETTSTSLMIIILHLLHHLDVQQKVHDEIDQVKDSWWNIILHCLNDILFTKNFIFRSLLLRTFLNIHIVIFFLKVLKTFYYFWSYRLWGKIVSQAWTIRTKCPTQMQSF